MAVNAEREDPSEPISSRTTHHSLSLTNTSGSSRPPLRGRSGRSLSSEWLRYRCSEGTLSITAHYFPKSLFIFYGAEPCGLIWPWGGNERTSRREKRELSHVTRQKGWHHVGAKRSECNTRGDAHIPTNDRYELEEKVSHTHTVFIRISIPHLDLWAQPGRLLSTRERETYTLTHTHTHCVIKPCLHVKVKWSRKTNRRVSSEPTVEWAQTLLDTHTSLIHYFSI